MWFKSPVAAAHALAAGMEMWLLSEAEHFNSDADQQWV